MRRFTVATLELRFGIHGPCAACATDQVVPFARSASVMPSPSKSPKTQSVRRVTFVTAAGRRATRAPNTGNGSSWRSPILADERLTSFLELRAAIDRQLESRMKYWEIIADNLSKAGWSWGCVSAVDCEGRTIWIADAHRGDGKRFVVRADEKLTAFMELESGRLACRELA